MVASPKDTDRAVSHCKELSRLPIGFLQALLCMLAFDRYGLVHCSHFKDVSCWQPKPETDNFGFDNRGLLQGVPENRWTSGPAIDATGSHQAVFLLAVGVQVVCTVVPQLFDCTRFMERGAGWKDVFTWRGICSVTTFPKA